MKQLTCDSPDCTFRQKITDADYDDGKWSLNCRCGSTVWVEELPDRRCLRCGEPSVDHHCASCTVVLVNRIIAAGGRSNPIIESEFDAAWRH